MQTQYYAGWDGGGTKTLCRVLYQDGTAPQPFTAGALNPNGTVAGQCEATVADLLRNMAALPGGLDACRMLCIGAAGISNPATRVHLQNALQAGGYHGPVTFTGDQQTALYDAVFKALQVGAVRELIGKIYAPGFGKREVAALAPLVGAAAEQGDAAALQIVEKAGRELALLVRPVAEKLGLQSARIAFAGSVLQKCAPVRSAAQTQLQTLLPQLTLAEPQGDAAAGAVLLARCKAEE